MKTKIIAGVVLMTLATAGTLTYAASTTTGSATFNKAFTKMHLTGSGESLGEHRGMMRGFNQGERGESGFMGRGPQANLTDAEKTQLETMTDVEKKAFFETKMTEQKALHDAKENVIDKLINGEALSDSEKVTLATIKTDRATQKAERLARETQMTEIKALRDKIKAGTALTTEEQAKLDTFKSTMKQGGQEGKGKKKGGRGMGMGR